MPIATIPPSSTATTSPALPPPQIFDILPPLHALLSRLLFPSPTDPSTPSPETITPLSPKDLATAASSVYAKIQKAKVVVGQLPGVEIGIEEQEGVIRELEKEVERLRGVEEGIGRAAREKIRSEMEERVQAEGIEGGEEQMMED